jgi:hypothetical protein
MNELEQYKEVNLKLQNRIIELQNELTKLSANEYNTSDTSDPKISKLERTKAETLVHIERLKKKQEELAEATKTQNNLQANIKKIIQTNIVKFANIEEEYYITEQEYTLPTELTNIVGIELTNFDLPFDKYNITINNNVLSFLLNSDINQNSDINENSDDITESSTANIIDTTENNFDNFDKVGDIDVEIVKVKQIKNNLKVVVCTGNYEIDNLIGIINKQLKKYEIEISLCSTTSLISIKSKNKLSLDFCLSNMFENLGFSRKKKYIDSKKYIGLKPYNFKYDKCYNIYLTNINTKKPIMQYMIGQSNSKKIVFDRMLKNLDNLVFKFTDSKDKEFKFDSDYGLDFGFKINIKLLNPQPVIVENSIDNDIDNITSDDVYTLVANSIK